MSVTNFPFRNDSSEFGKSMCKVHDELPVELTDKMQWIGSIPYVKVGNVHVDYSYLYMYPTTINASNLM